MGVRYLRNKWQDDFILAPNKKDECLKGECAVGFYGFEHMHVTDRILSMDCRYEILNNKNAKQ